MSPVNESLFEFPCDFPIKIMGKSHPEFAETIVTVVRQFDNDVDAFAMVKELAAREGVLSGSSGGANVVAALRVAGWLGRGKRVVTMIPDSAERYLSKKIFDGGV